MKIAPEYLVERRRSKNSIKRWKIVSVLLILLAIFFAGKPYGTSKVNSSISLSGDYVASIEINEIILEDFITVEGKPIPYISLYGFDSNLDDSGSNAITAVSNFGAPTYVEDRNSTASSAWESPNTADNWLTIPGYKGISADGTRTVMARFNTAAGTSRKTLVSWGTNASGKMFNVMLQGGQIRVEAGACSLRTSRTDLMDGKWHHVAVTFDPADGDKLSDAKVFIDGVLDANLEDGPGKSYRSTTTIIDTDSNAEVRIGNSIYASNRYFFNGIIDDVAILDVILIPEQIKAIAGE